MEVRSVLTLTCVVWVCVLLSKGSPQPSRSVGISHVWLHLKSHLPFSLCPGQAGSSWEPRGDGVSRAGGSPRAHPRCISLAQGSQQGLSLHRDTPNRAVNLLFPLCASGAGPNPHQRFRATGIHLSTLCTWKRCYSKPGISLFVGSKLNGNTSHLLEVLIAHSVQRGFMVHATIILCYCPLKEFC